MKPKATRSPGRIRSSAAGSSDTIRLRLELPGGELEIATDVPAVERYLRAVYRAQPGSRDRPGFAGWIGFPAGTPEVRFGSESLIFAGPREVDGDLLAFYAVSQLVQRALRSADGVAMHLVALVLGERGLAIAGPSGAGKTTLALHLLARGARVIGDEYIVLDPAGTTMRGVARTMMVREGSLPGLDPQYVERITSAPARLAGAQRIFDTIDPRVVFGAAAQARSAPLEGLILLGPSAPHEDALQPLAPSVAALQLRRYAVREPRGFDELAAFARRFAGVRCYRLGRDDPARMAEAVMRAFT